MLLKRITRWLKYLILRFSGKKSLKYKFKIVKELPEHLENNVFYVEGNKVNNDFWYGQMICPCGCNEKLTLNLIDDIRPCWSIHVVKNKISITPSIWRTKNCKSHFWLKDGLINWV